MNRTIIAIMLYRVRFVNKTLAHPVPLAFLRIPLGVALQLTAGRPTTDRSPPDITYYLTTREIIHIV